MVCQQKIQLTLLALVRTLETIVDYCRERLDRCESKVERDEININQLTPSGSTPDAVHDQIVQLKVRQIFFVGVRESHIQDCACSRRTSYTLNTVEFAY